MKRETRDRRLTSEEAARYNAVREAVEQEKPQINQRIREQIASSRRNAAKQAGVSTLGQRICTAREAAGQSQTSLASAAGISEGYLSQIEQDEREPTLSVAARLAAALRISLDQLASGAL